MLYCEGNVEFMFNKIIFDMEGDFSNYVSSLVDRLRGIHDYRTADAYLSTSRSVVRFMGGSVAMPILFCESRIKDYEQYLWYSGCCRNTISFYMRMLQSIYNQAVKSGQVDKVESLFANVFTGRDDTRKRAVDFDVLAYLRDADLEGRRSLEVCRDYFLLSFFLCGIPFVDLAFLRKADYSHGIITYRRHKTESLIVTSVIPQAARIIERYVSPDEISPYLLPIINRSAKNGWKTYQSALRLYNKNLKTLSDYLGLKVNLSSYVPRHTWATLAHQVGVPVSYISSIMGHHSEGMTQIYLDSIDRSVLDKANQKVMDVFDKYEKKG